MRTKRKTTKKIIEEEPEEYEVERIVSHRLGSGDDVTTY
jgi:hypothetical protein